MYHRNHAGYLIGIERLLLSQLPDEFFRVHVVAFTYRIGMLR